MSAAQQPHFSQKTRNMGTPMSRSTRRSFATSSVAIKSESLPCRHLHATGQHLAALTSDSIRLIIRAIPSMPE
jgi:hypothetical protein